LHSPEGRDVVLVNVREQEGVALLTALVD